MFFDRPESGELAILVHLDINLENNPEDPREFEELVLSAGGDPVELLTGHRVSPNSKYFIGTGKLEELRELVQLHQAELVIFNHALSPSQERNIEQALNCRVLDRTGLILDIFAQRARTHEGKLQVELAQLRHMSTRLVRGWTHLERQKGGIGLRGPGETQLETDRRLLRARITAIESRLSKVRRQRDQGRRSRRRAEVPTVSLVGYTNAGKSTLFNSLTGADVYAEDKLFATLDPTMRRVELPELGSAIFADTVGFISHLPHKLVEAFRATLEEAASSDLLLHVIDVAAENREDNIHQVQEVLEEIGAHTLPQLRVYNKLDLVPHIPPRVDRDDLGRPIAVWLSAKTGAGTDLLLAAVAELLGREMIENTLVLAPEQARFRARLHALNAVQNEVYAEDGEMNLQLKMSKIDLLRIVSSEGLTWDSLRWSENQGVSLKAG